MEQPDHRASPHPFSILTPDEVPLSTSMHEANSYQSNMLKQVISEATPKDASAPGFKFACNSTIVQHLVPTSALNKSRGGAESKAEEPHISTSSEATATDGKPHVGRRGMHSATGAYWDEKKDGMWTFKYDGGEGKGLDVVIMLIWVAI